MKSTFLCRQPPLLLSQGRLWRADPKGAPLLLVCQSGLLWVTQENNRQDILLSAGDRFLSATSGRLVAQALEPSALCLQPVQSLL